MGLRDSSESVSCGAFYLVDVGPTKGRKRRERRVKDDGKKRKRRNGGQELG